MLVSADRVGDAHEDGGVSRRHVQVVDPEACPGEAAQPQGEREEGGGGAAGHDQGGQRHEERLNSSASKSSIRRFVITETAPALRDRGVNARLARLVS